MSLMLRRTLPLSACTALVFLFAACGDDTKSPDDTGIADVTDTADAADTGNDTAESDDADGSGDPDADPGDAFTIAGLDGPVDVWTDAYGIPHIVCVSDEDCVAALGYLHARDRFVQMDIRRRLTTGRLHQLIGTLAMDTDTANRRLYSTPDGRPAEDALYENLTEDSLAVLEAYSRGVNAWLDDLEAGRNGARLAVEYEFPLIDAEEIPRWTPRDCLSTVLALINSLTNDSGRELALGRRYAGLPPEQAADAFGPTPATDATVMSSFEFPQAAGSGAPAAMIERLRGLDTLLREAESVVTGADVLRKGLQPGDSGSNNWVVGPELTTDGVALLSNDPHLGLSNPAVWYLAHMDAVTHGDGTFQAAGQTFAGLPWVILGQNANIAWGATNSFFDLSDVYIETLTEDGDGVVFNGEDVPFVEVDFTMHPYDGEPTTRTLLFVPHHGPLLSIDEEEGTAVSLAWTGNRVTTDGNFLTELMRASTTEEAREALRAVTSIGQNWVVADTAGSIGWFPYNQIPTRPWASMEMPSFLPLPGDGSAEWGPALDLDDIPQLHNPEAGYIATANNDMTGALLDGDPFNDGATPLQVYSAAGYRQARIIELLEEGAGDHDLASMESIIGDTLSSIGRELVPALLEIVEEESFTGAAANLMSALEAWDFDCPTGIDGIEEGAPLSDDADEIASSAGCTAFHVLMGRLRGVFADEIAAAGVGGSAEWSALTRLLLRPETMEYGAAWWDDVSTEGDVETALEMVSAAIEASGAWLEGELGADIDGWRWGLLHTLTLRADLFDSFNVPAYNNGTWVNDGGLYTVDVANPRSLQGNDYSHTSGASTRWVCEAPSTGVRCRVQIPGGQVHHRDSPHYEDMLERWLVNESVPLEFDADAARDNAASHVAFEAAD